MASEAYLTYLQQKSKQKEQRLQEEHHRQRLSKFGDRSFALPDVSAGTPKAKPLSRSPATNQQLSSWRRLQSGQVGSPPDEPSGPSSLGLNVSRAATMASNAPLANLLAPRTTHILPVSRRQSPLSAVTARLKRQRESSKDDGSTSPPRSPVEDELVREAAMFEEAKALFNVFDSDGDGWVDVNAFGQLIEETMHITEMDQHHNPREVRNIICGELFYKEGDDDDAHDSYANNGGFNSHRPPQTHRSSKSFDEGLLRGSHQSVSQPLAFPSASGSGDSTSRRSSASGHLLTSRGGIGDAVTAQGDLAAAVRTVNGMHGAHVVRVNLETFFQYYQLLHRWTDWETHRVSSEEGSERSFAMDERNAGSRRAEVLKTLGDIPGGHLFTEPDVRGWARRVGGGVGWWCRWVVGGGWKGTWLVVAARFRGTVNGPHVASAVALNCFPSSNRIVVLPSLRLSLRLSLPPSLPSTTEPPVDGAQPRRIVLRVHQAHVHEHAARPPRGQDHRCCAPPAVARAPQFG
jgi:hypothetical protein